MRPIPCPFHLGAPRRLLISSAASLVALLSPPALRAGPSLGLPVDIVVEAARPGVFPLVTTDRAAPLWYDADDHPGVVRALLDLQVDIERVPSRRPAAFATQPADPQLVIVGTVEKSATIDSLVAAGKLDASDLRGRWESFVITTVADPLPGVRQALVVAGSDKRGTIYGIYELSEQLGVSPWYWWADVPVKKRAQA
jgi:hypothetical protein